MPRKTSCFDQTCNEFISDWVVMACLGPKLIKVLLSSKWGNFQKYWSQNVGQDFIVLDFFVGGRSCGRERCVREINVSSAGDPVHAGDKTLTVGQPLMPRKTSCFDQMCNEFISDWVAMACLGPKPIKVLFKD
jgi:hypothetical protein